MSLFSIYCDESCHLEKDRHRAMVLGAIWTPKEFVVEFSSRVKDIKRRHNIAQHIELKWGKISPKHVSLYEDLVNYFFDNSDLHFRTIVIPDKSLLKHEKFDQNHDDWYYKMYFHLLEVILSPTDQYEIYLDIKDTLGGYRVANLKKALANTKYDFSFSIVRRVQTVRSHEIQLLQLADVLIGSVSSANRDDTSSEAKKRIVSVVKQRSGYDLTRSTLLREDKFNIFRWSAQIV